MKYTIDPYNNVKHSKLKNISRKTKRIQKKINLDDEKVRAGVQQHQRDETVDELSKIRSIIVSIIISVDALSRDYSP